jgi:hypothetical protein
MIFLLLSGAGAVRGEVKPVELPHAIAGKPYAYALETNKPAHFIKAGGNADWLKITREGVLTGTPPNDRSGLGLIEVEAQGWAGDDRAGSEVLRGWFAVPVEASNCVGDATDQLAWCDGVVGEQIPVATVVGQRHGKDAPIAFAPMETAAEADSAIDSHVDCGNRNGCVVQFDRLHEQTGKLGHYDPEDRSFHWSHEGLDSPSSSSLKSDIVRSINGSKVFMSGSVLINVEVKNCTFYSWSVVTQTVDSSNNLFYGPSDLSAFCPNDKTVLIVLPVHAIWANVYGIPANTNDPTWRPLAKPPQPHECWTGAELWNSPTQGIKVCDLTSAPPGHEYDDEKPGPGFKTIGYSGFIEWLYNRGEQPGVSQGSISIAPVATSTKSTMDVQIYESWQQQGRPGWFGFQSVYEHDRKPADDLNSLTTALTYDYRICNNRRYWWEWGAIQEQPGKCSILADKNYESSAKVSERPPFAGIRPVEFIMRVGAEWAPSAEKVKGGFYVRRDLNMVTGESVRIPIVINPAWQSYARTPSQLIITAVEGVEAGTRMAPHPIGSPPVWEPRTILRQVPGADVSFRWPYQITRNFLGDKPITVDASYRARLLYRAEPSFDERFAAKNPTKAVEEQSTTRRSYLRMNFIAPFSAYLQLRVTWQRGDLPPAFQYVGNLWTVGFTFSNPGSSEH